MRIGMDGVMEVVFAELWDRIGGGTRFTSDEIVGMMAECRGRMEDFRMIHNADRYVVRLEAIEDYFQTHPTPEKPMKAEERVKALQAELQEARRAIQEARNSARATQAEVPRPEPFNPMDTLFPGQIETPQEPEPKRESVDVRPVPFESIAAELKAELIAKKARPQVKNRTGEVPLL